MSESNEKYKSLTHVQKVNTKYFLDNNICETETPYTGSKRPAVPATGNPITLSKRRRTDDVVTQVDEEADGVVAKVGEEVDDVLTRINKEAAYTVEA